MSLRLRWLRPPVLALLLVLLATPAFGADDAAVARELGLLLPQVAKDRALAPAGHAAAVGRFYELTGRRPAWRQDGAWSAEAKAALATLEAAHREGLDPGDYPGPAFRGLPVSGSAAEIARSDLLLSAGMLRYIGDVKAGRVVPSTLGPQYAVHPVRPDAPAVLAEGLKAQDFSAWLSRLPPDDPAYRRLRHALSVYRDLAAKGPWPRLPDGPTLRAGASGEDVAVLRRQLSLLGDLPAQDGAGPADFDAALDAAVRRFQRRHGLQVDGAVGVHTRAALAVTPQARARTIALNLERLRWFPHPAPDRYIVINAAGFGLTAIAHGKVAAEMPVIVGKPSWRTPLFEDEITGVTFMPTWTVPPNILRKEVLPKIKRNPDYLAQHNMKVYSGWGSDACEVDPLDVDWKSIGPGASGRRFVQQPGPSNALGRIRFTLHNEFGVFLHDTPAKELFGREVRAYSHGCVRVGDAAALAAFVFNGDPNWPPAAIEAAMNGGETREVDLRAPVPVEMTYLTAWVEEDGTVQFRADVYGRDPPLAGLLGQAP